MHARTAVLALGSVVVAACLAGCASDDAPPATSPGTVVISGDAIPFSDGPNGRVHEGVVSILEQPGRSLVTEVDGKFSFNELKPGAEVTLRMEAPGYAKIQTATISMPEGGASRVTFQAVTDLEYVGLALFTQTEIDDTKCQMVTTVTRIGKSIYDVGAHGEDGVKVTVDPPLPKEIGPVYFNSAVRPDRTLDQTSDDGGVLFINVPPGTYTLTGTKNGAVFTTLKMKCEAGWLVNASPPWGLQRLQ